ncbi:MAG: KH domain-containing protein [Hydrococcus sp. C42_A2020_068]|nr:KH domain-containing protein [Hydrococcus sp. C42_A2020_068]
MLKATNLSKDTQTPVPDYCGLVKFLVSPFLESPELLSIDCEQFNQNTRVWVRLAFEGTDKGRVFGRGGRNLQAIRTVLETAAAAAGQSLYLDIYESQSEKPKRREGRDNNGSLKREREGRTRARRPHSPRSSGKSRF